MGDYSVLAQLEQDLIDNSLAFLRRALRQTIAAEKDTQQLSFAVVDLAVAIEVLLKARLVREHWTLILDNLDNGKQDQTALIAGSAKTVTVTQAVERLERLTPVSLGSAKGDKKCRATQVRGVTTLRNQAAHFTLGSMLPLSIRARLGVGLQFVLWFLETEFANGPAKAQVDELLRDIAIELGRVEELVRERMVELGPVLNQAVACVECPRCSQPTLMLHGAMVCEPTCPFCRSIDASDAGPALAEEYVETVLNLSSHELVQDGGIWPVHDCPECDEEALVAGVKQIRPVPPEYENDFNSGPVYWGCFSCGLAKPSHELHQCVDCDRVCDAECSRCGDCISRLLARD